MRYFGSKGSVIDEVGQIVLTLKASGTICDPFGGIGVVGRYFKTAGFTVTSGDVLTFATMFQTATLCRSTPLGFRRLRVTLGLTTGETIENFLSRLPPARRDHWLVVEYSIKRQFFTFENARAIAAIWATIHSWHSSLLTTPTEHSVLVASLIDSMDRVANTAGTYYAYLKRYCRKALQPFAFRILPAIRGPRGSVILDDALVVVGRQHYDVLYLDPPYNERDHGAYYHLPETIAKGKSLDICGKSGIPRDQEPKSRFARPQMAIEAIEELLRAASFEALLFHYANNGIVPARQLEMLLRSLGRLTTFSLNALGYRTTSGDRSAEHTLYVVQHA